MKKKSPIDNLFFEIFGYYPKKAGAAYEILVAAAIKIITGETIHYDQNLKGIYSKTNYQVDAINKSENKIIEAKDYTIQNKKVGRPDLQKLQGALSDLSVNSGIFASATDYTRPAKKYSESSNENLMQKEIELYQIRPSTVLDEKGRIKSFEIEMIILTHDFDNAKYACNWTNEAIQKIIDNGFDKKTIKARTDRFYDKNGKLNELLSQFTYENQPIHSNMEDEFAIGCWLLYGNHIKYENQLYELKGIEYKIPFKKSSSTFTIESDGEPVILIKSEDKKINKLITDKQFKDLVINDKQIN